MKGVANLKVLLNQVDVKNIGKIFIVGLDLKKKILKPHVQGYPGVYYRDLYVQGCIGKDVCSGLNVGVYYKDLCSGMYVGVYYKDLC